MTEFEKAVWAAAFVDKIVKQRHVIDRQLRNLKHNPALIAKDVTEEVIYKGEAWMAADAANMALKIFHHIPKENFPKELDKIWIVAFIREVVKYIPEADYQLRNMEYNSEDVTEEAICGGAEWEAVNAANMAVKIFHHISEEDLPKGLTNER